MAKIITKNSFVPGSTPSGLSAGELAVNVVDKKIFAGNAVGAVVTLHDQQNVVTSVNGQTGAVVLTGLTASQVLIGSSNVNATRYLTFVGGSGTTGLFIDDVTTPLSYNPLQGNIGAKKVTLTTSSNVITLDSASPAVIITDGASVSTFSADSFSAASVSKFTVSNAIGITLQGGNGPNQGIGIAMTNASYEFPVVNGSSGRAMVWPSSGSGLTWSDVVTSVNGSAGAVTNVARLNEGNTFSVRQVMNAGITASNLYVSSGSTFNSTVEISSTTNTLDIIASTNGAGLRIAQATSGSSSRVGSIRLGRSATPTSNLFLEGFFGSFRVYNGLSGSQDSTQGTKMLDLSTTNCQFGVPIAGATFTGLLSSTSGICANGGICGGTYISSEGGYRVTSNAIKALTGTTYTFLTSDDGKIITSSNSSAQVFTIPTGLPIGFNCSVIQLGTGVVGFVPASGVTLNSFAGKTFMAGQHAAVSIIEYANNIVNVAGGLTA